MSGTQAPPQDTSAAASARRLAAARRRHRSGDDSAPHAVLGLTPLAEPSHTTVAASASRMSSSAAASGAEAAAAIARHGVALSTPDDHSVARNAAAVALASYGGRNLPPVQPMTGSIGTPAWWSSSSSTTAGAPSMEANDLYYSAARSRGAELSSSVEAGTRGNERGQTMSSFHPTDATTMLTSSPARGTSLLSNSRGVDAPSTLDPSLSARISTRGGGISAGAFAGNLQHEYPLTTPPAVRAATSARSARTPVTSNLLHDPLSTSLLHDPLSTSSMVVNKSASAPLSSSAVSTTTKPFPSGFASAAASAHQPRLVPRQPTSTTTPPRRSAASHPSQTPHYARGDPIQYNPRKNSQWDANPLSSSLQVPITIEDRERVLRESLSSSSASWNDVPRDAACLVSGTKVQIFAFRPSSSTAASSAATPIRFYRQEAEGDPLGGSTDDDREAGEGDGAAVIRVDANGSLASTQPVCYISDSTDNADAYSNNTEWTIVKTGSGSSTMAPLTFPGGGEGMICFGDVVVLRACPSDSADFPDCELALSVARPEGSAPRLRVSPAVAGSREQKWTLLRGMTGPDALVRLGESSLREAPDSSAVRSRRVVEAVKGSAMVAMTSCSPFVRSGDSLMLRSCASGSILSVQDDGSLALMTDSYDSDKSLTDSSLLMRLQRHDLLSPSDRELFYFFPSSVSSPWLRPPRDDFDPWSFVDGSYLLHENRNLMDPSTMRSIFNDAQPGDAFNQSLGPNWDKQMRDVMLQPQAQELLLLDEVLGSFLGLEGNYVRVRKSWHHGVPHLSFHVVDDPSKSLVLDLSLRNILEEELLPLSSAYVNVQYFLGSHLNRLYDYGSVMQALCEKLDSVVCDYVTFVNCLEMQYREVVSCVGHGPQLMRRLLADIQETAHKMRVLRNVVDAVKAEKGGALLNALEKARRVYDGDAVASHLVDLLLEASAVPYMQMLCRWIESGRLEDPHDEFMIRFDVDARTWESQYVIINNQVLTRFFGSEATVFNVVATGRFWNAIRMSQRRGATQNDVHTRVSIKYSSRVSEVLTRVQVLHRAASGALIDLLLGECDVFRSLRLTKRYFLLDQGDFFVRFMDAAEDELLKDSTDISLGRIQHWFSSAINLTDQDATEVQPESREIGSLLASDLVTRFTTSGLLVHLDKLLASSNVVDPRKRIGSPRHKDARNSNTDPSNGLDTFLIDFKSVPFPLSLVLTKQAMASYQLLFRHLFYTKYVERRLVGIWQDHQALRELQALRGALGGTFLLRQRMLHFVQNLIYHMMLEVIEPNWKEFEKEILSPDAVEKLSADDVCASHTRFLRNTLEACLMTNRDVLGSITKLLGTCLLFTNEMKTFMQATNVEADRRAVTKDKRSRFQRSLAERSVSRRSSLSRSTVDKILIEDMAERRARVQQQTARVRREVSSESYRTMIARFDEVFSDHLSDFMLQLKYADGLVHSHKINLCTRLDYNGFVSRAFGLSEPVSKRKLHRTMGR